MFVFICFSAATATAENLQTIFITRFFGGMYVLFPAANPTWRAGDLIQILIFASHYRWRVRPISDTFQV